VDLRAVRGRPALAEFSHPAITLGPPAPHGNKLRRGHLHGNRFALVVRDLAVPGNEAARERVAAKAAKLAELGGLDNLYGNQRLGNDGGNLRRGLELLASGARRGKADFLLSAGQSALFNLYLLERRARGLMRTVLLGDILKKTATGGLFESREPEVDQARLDAGELGITGPMFGSKMRGPSPGTAPDALEQEILDLAGISPEARSRPSVARSRAQAPPAPAAPPRPPDRPRRRRRPLPLACACTSPSPLAATRPCSCKNFKVLSHPPREQARPRPSKRRQQRTLAEPGRLGYGSPAYS
jgi:tRNA(Glu) U13 pseudouridine synthase TruD